MTSARPEIRRPEAIDAAWMTAVIRGAGYDVTVSDVTASNVGTGQIGECVRLQIDYHGSSGAAPKSMVGKFPSPNPESFRAGLALGDYAREVRFYRDLADGALVSAPGCYLAELDDESGEFVLLLEDLSPARQGDQLTGVSLDQARLVVGEAAKLHASHWNDPEIAQLDWIRLTPGAPHPLPPPESIQRTCEAFCERYASNLDARVVGACRRYAERVAHYRALPRSARCLAHYDYRPDNMMFADLSEVRPVTILDWQTLSHAPGADDLAYFLAGALPAPVRRAHENEMLERYMNGLTKLGVRGYAMKDLQHDYALGGFRLLATAMGGSMAARQTERGDRMFMQMIAAAAEFLSDHDSLALLD